MTKISHKTDKVGVVCGAHFKRIASTRRYPLISEMYWGHVTCKTCLRQRPAVKKKKPTFQGEFLPVGAKIAQLSHELHSIGAHQAARHVQQAADIFHEDVIRILDLREKRRDRLRVRAGRRSP